MKKLEESVSKEGLFFQSITKWWAEKALLRAVGYVSFYEKLNPHNHLRQAY